MAVFICPNCLHTQDAPDAYIGRAAKCMKCETQATIIKQKRALPPPAPLAMQPKETVAPTTEDKIHPGAAFSHNDGRIVIGLLAAMLMAQLFGLTSTKTSTTQWEYWIEAPSDSKLQVALADLGNEGWELVFARRATSEFGGSASYEMVFKRPKR